MSSIFNSIRNFVVTIINMLVSFLPDSPFSNINLGVLEEYLGYINWIVPIGQIMAVTLSWAGAIGVYYIYSTILRWLKTIE